MHRSGTCMIIRIILSHMDIYAEYCTQHWILLPVVVQ